MADVVSTNLRKAAQMLDEENWALIERLQHEVQETRDALARAELAATTNAEQYAAQKKAHREESDRYYAESGHLNKMAGELRDERNKIFAEVQRLRRQVVPPQITAKLFAFIFENEHAITVDDARTLGSLREADAWRAYGFALHSIFHDVASGKAIYQLCERCKRAECVGCGDSTNNRDGAFPIPRQLAEEIAEWRAAVSR